MHVVRIAALLSLLVLGACQSSARIDPVDHPEYAKLKPEIVRLVTKMRSCQGPALYVALQELVAYDIFAVDLVSKLVEDPNPRLRSNALWVLYQINDPEYPKVQENIDGLLIDSLDDPDRLVRFEAASGLVSRNKWEHIPVLFEGLRDPSAAVRFSCHATLQDVTAQNFGFAVDGETDDREQALVRWCEWYEDWRSRTRG